MSVPAIPTITAFERSPDGGKGLARDTRVRWALEEVGQSYDVRLVSFTEMKAPAHRALHPFGQRAITWMFAALNTVEPAILEFVSARLQSLSDRLGDADWLDGAFSAGDLMMVSVLLRLKSSGMLNDYPNLAVYVARGEARPAYQRAFDAQLAVFTGQLPSS